MTIKSAMDADGGVATETMADRLRNVQTETWQRMEWVHDEAEMAWEAYNECLLLRPGANSTRTAGSGGGGDGEGGGEEEGKGKEVATTEAVPAGDESGAADLVEKVSRLKTDWGEQELLQAISGVEGERAEDATGQGNGEKAVVKAEEQPAEGSRQTVRVGRGAAATSSAATAGASNTRKSTRARGTNRGGAIEID